MFAATSGGCSIHRNSIGLKHVATNPEPGGALAIPWYSNFHLACLYLKSISLVQAKNIQPKEPIHHGKGRRQVTRLTSSPISLPVLNGLVISIKDDREIDYFPVSGYEKAVETLDGDTRETFVEGPYELQANTVKC